MFTLKYSCGGTIRQLQYLQDLCDTTYRENIILFRRIDTCVLLGEGAQIAMILVGSFDSIKGTFPTQGDWQHHIREQHHITKRKDRNALVLSDIVDEARSPIRNQREKLSSLFIIANSQQNVLNVFLHYLTYIFTDHAILSATLFEHILKKLIERH